MSFSSIFDDHKILSFRDVHDAFHVRRVPVKMYWHDRLGPGGDRLLDLLRIDTQIIRIDIYDNGFCPGMNHRICSGNERKVGYDHLISGPNPVSDQSQVDCDGAI